MIIQFNYWFWNYRYLNNNLISHRLGGPSYEGKSGSKYWFVNGNYHREDGPAVECGDGRKFYYLNHKEYRENKYWSIVRFRGFM